jgi:Tol biopolymer transport system component
MNRKMKLVAATVALAAAGAAAAKNWEAWDPPVNLEALPGSSNALNTPAVDGCAALSNDGLTIVFNSNRTGNFDLYTAHRASPSDGFGAPQRLPAPVNGARNEACATFGPGNRLYFASDRDDPAYDLYVAKQGPNGWGAPQRLGPNINTPGMLEEAADFYEDDEGREVMIFTRRNGAGTVGKIYYSVEGGPAFPLSGGVSSSAADARASITSDGLTIFFDSNRSGLGGPDLFTASRSNTSEPFGSAVWLQSLSSPGFDARPFISKDGTQLTFSSNRAGSEWSGTGPTPPDMWIAARDKRVGSPE